MERGIFLPYFVSVFDIYLRKDKAYLLGRNLWRQMGTVYPLKVLSKYYLVVISIFSWNVILEVLSRIYYWICIIDMIDGVFLTIKAECYILVYYSYVVKTLMSLSIAISYFMRYCHYNTQDSHLISFYPLSSLFYIPNTFTRHICNSYKKTTGV